MKFKELVLRFPAEDFDDIIKSYAGKTNFKEKVDLPKKQGKIKKIKNPLSMEQHVAKVLQDRLVSLNK